MPRGPSETAYMSRLYAALRAVEARHGVRSMARRMLRARAQDASGLIRAGDLSKVAQACLDAHLGEITPQDVLLIVAAEARKLGL